MNRKDLWVCLEVDNPNRVRWHVTLRDRPWTELAHGLAFSQENALRMAEDWCALIAETGHHD